MSIEVEMMCFSPQSFSEVKDETGDAKTPPFPIPFMRESNPLTEGRFIRSLSETSESKEEKNSSPDPEEFLIPHDIWIKEYEESSEETREETKLYKFVDSLESKDKLFNVMESIVKSPFLNCDLIFNKALQKIDPSASTTLSHKEAQLIFDKMTKETRPEGVSSIHIDEDEISSEIKKFYNNHKLRCQHMFVFCGGFHTFPIYLEKDEDGKISMLVTDSKGSEPSEILSYLLPDPEYFKAIYVYSEGRQKTNKGCGVFSLRDAVKTFHRQHQEGCMNLFDWIAQYGNVIPHFSNSRVKPCYPIYEFSTLPPEFLKTAQSRKFLFKKMPITNEKVLPTFHTREGDGVRREVPEDMEALFRAFTKHKEGDHNLHVERLMRKYKTALYKDYY